MKLAFVSQNVFYFSLDALPDGTYHRLKAGKDLRDKAIVLQDYPVGSQIFLNMWEQEKPDGLVLYLSSCVPERVIIDLMKCDVRPDRVLIVTCKCCMESKLEALKIAHMETAVLQQSLCSGFHAMYTLLQEFCQEGVFDFSKPHL